jgi:hypothetical protein
MVSMRRRRRPVWTLRFSGDRLVLQQRANVSFGPVDSPDLEGQQGGFIIIWNILQ